MTLRPASATWFELLTSREELGATLDCLAGTGSVQLEAYSRSVQRLALPDLRATLAEYETLARRYGHYWPNAVALRHTAEHALLEAPRDALERARGWAKAADPLIAEHEELAQSAEDTALLTQLQARSGESLARLDQVAHAGPGLAGRAYLLPEGGPPHALPPDVLLQRVPVDERLIPARRRRQERATIELARGKPECNQLRLVAQLSDEDDAGREKKGGQSGSQHAAVESTLGGYGLGTVSWCPASRTPLCAACALRDHRATDGGGLRHSTLCASPLPQLPT